MKDYEKKLQDDLDSKIKKDESIYGLEKALIPVLVRMRERGLLIDQKRLDKEMGDLETEFDKLSTELCEEVGYDFRVNSGKDLALVWETLQLPAPGLTTAKGAVSYAEPSLKYIKDNPFVEKLIVARHIKAVISAHKDIERNRIDNELHSEFLPLGKDGGSRIYTTKPSVNQTPKELRRAIVPRPGFKFWYLDWSGAEIYHLAKRADQLDLVEIYESGGDLHRYISAKILGLIPEEITPEQREISKIVTFSIVYGSEGDAAARATMVERDEAVGWVQSFYIAFPQIKEFMDFQVLLAREEGCAYTWLGRKRKLWKIRHHSSSVQREGERQAMNTPIQNGVADLLKWAMIRIDKNLPELELVFVVFDSFLIEVPIELEMEDYVDRLKEVSHFKHKGEEQVFNFEIKEGYSWGDLMDA